MAQEAALRLWQKTRNVDAEASGSCASHAGVFGFASNVAKEFTREFALHRQRTRTLGSSDEPEDGKSDVLEGIAKSQDPPGTHPDEDSVPGSLEGEPWIEAHLALLTQACRKAVAAACSIGGFREAGRLLNRSESGVRKHFERAEAILHAVWVEESTPLG